MTHHGLSEYFHVVKYIFVTLVETVRDSSSAQHAMNSIDFALFMTMRLLVGENDDVIANYGFYPLYFWKR